jgi:serine/threonine-protein kinase
MRPSDRIGAPWYNHRVERARWAVVAVAVAVLAAPLLPVTAAAQTPPAPATPADGDREAQRTDLYKQAVDLANAGRWADAAEKLRAVLAIRSSPKVRFTLGQAEEHVGRLSTAYDAYAQALADAEAARQTDVADTAGVALRSLGPRVPVVRVVVTGEGASAATATIDDHAAHIGEPVRVDPGTHHIAVSAAGARTVESTVTVAESQHLDVPVELAQEEATVTPASPAPAPEGEAPSTTSRSNLWPTVGLIAAGVGVVGLGVGTYFGFDAISKNNASNQSGCNGNTCTAGAYGTREDAKSSATLSTVSFVAGGLLAAGGVTLWLLAPRGDASVQVAPVALAGGGGMLVGGVWR